MDERTRSTDDDLAPSLRRTAPDPIVRTRSRAKLFIGLGVVAIALVLATYQAVRFIHAPAPSGRRGQGAPQTVGAATVTLGNIRVIVNALGTVTPLATVTVQSQISGYLTQVGFTEGQMVQKGDFLAQIDPRPYEMLKEQYEGQLAHDQGLLAQAQLDLKRYQTLAAQNSIAKQQAEDQVFIVQQYEGSVKQDQGLIDAQALNIAYCHIASPITGRIGLRLVDPGNYVQTTSTTGLAVITQMQPITVIFTLPEDDLPEIMSAMNAGTPLTVDAYDRANLRHLATGKVAAVDSQIDTTTGTVKIRAQFDNTDDALFPNQFVNARVLIKTLENVVTVPTPAILRGSPGAYVYVINPNNTVSVRQITTGAVDGNTTAVTAGLSAGERVVIDGTDRLRDGLRVAVTAEQPAAAVGAPGSTDGGQRRGNRSATSQTQKSDGAKSDGSQPPPSGGQ
ncbi:MAG TPA: MdtA/MuxA family multidrug efflux RND transporter periplasmic adaptor subunit [Xanthobacteraceae bacterium]|nr:MdtA/MuxA family multidrug efflux RND transporter periplasmic adaptor subunit [Xanthobacteraceae bacterium]